ncbi:MAG: CRISPR-associated helicase Cas3' [Hyphomicrobiales bacterium]|jgi:CRISPR-associated endonuclease/helicase Cas3|nr:CRISPR-associated helicase Cas3' [Hyphomicrobiales bacterium]
MLASRAFPSSEARLAVPWAKFDGEDWHHLAHHCADVAACFEALAATPVWRARLEAAADGSLDDATVSRLAVLCFLHDIGKLHPGFQAKRWPNSGIVRHGHCGEGAAVMLGQGPRPIAKALHLETIFRWGDQDTLTDLMSAVFAHHGRPVPDEPMHRQDWSAGARLGYDPAAEAGAIGELLPSWFPAAFAAGGAPLPHTPRFQHLFCGLVALADWIGSNRAAFPFVPTLDAGYIGVARQRAAQAISGIGLDVSVWRERLDHPPAFAAIAPGREARGAQMAIGEWPLDDPLVILEAETGSGKTEAALWRFARLFQAGLVDALYFAVPTRAAAKQLQGRVNRSMIDMFGQGAPEAVLAVPGYLKAGDHVAQSLPDFQVRWDDNPDEEKRLSRWAAESARRFLAAPVAVGTVDQAMLGALQVKHAHLRHAALARSLLVIDEVHASDGYMTAVQSQLIDAHLVVGGHAMLMSATLGAEAREKWLHSRRAQPPSVAEAEATPYPAVWGRRGGLKPVAAGDRRKEVAIRLATGWSGDVAATEAVAMARGGARVLMIRNTVTAALAAFEAVRAMGAAHLLWQVAGGPALHHSRFAPEDRALLDHGVEAALSKDADKRPHGGVIVIGTQTLEQSLDLCADALVTDLCPSDVLLQRIGRLHRHALPRPPGFGRATCVVLTPEGGLDRLAAPAFENGIGQFRDGGGVYRNLHACELTRRLIEAHRVWNIPAMNRMLVEGATHPDMIAALSAEKGKAWESYWHSVYGKDIAEAQAGRLMRLAVDEPFSELRFPCDDEKVRTRLGAEGARIMLAPGTMGPFGQLVSSLTCPAHWRVAPPEEAVVAAGRGADEIEIKVGKARFVYGRNGLERVTA